MDLKIDKILVPVDFGAAWRPLTAYAGSLAGRIGATVHLVHVVDELLAPEVGWAPARAAAALHDELYRAAGAKLAAAVRVLEQLGVPATYEIRGGLPLTEIIGAATDVRADLVVMATHTSAGNGQASLGSVADHIVRHAHCPVLTVGDALLEAGSKANEPIASCASGGPVDP
jgi:nucleotide-binding universal stress UspA family protein